MMMSTCAKLGIIVALVVSMAVSYIAKNQWQFQESITYNLFLLALPWIMPFRPVMTMLDSVDQQDAFWQQATKNMEDSQTEFGAKLYGPSFWEASYGETATLRVESRITSLREDGYEIPILCAAPQPHDDNNNNNNNNNKKKQDKLLPLILHFHGGGLILGSHLTEELTVRGLAQDTHAVVCSIGYRHAPKYPYPIPVDDAVEASVALLEGRHTLPSSFVLDPSNVATYGVSAGGYMAAHAARRLTQLGHAVQMQVSVIPMVVPHANTHSMLRYWYKGSWSGIQNTYAWTSYLPKDNGTFTNDWTVNLLQDPPNVSDLPPAHVVVHTRDILRDEGVLYAERLRHHKKLVHMDEYNTCHIGGLPGISNGGPGQDEYPKVVQMLNEYLHA